MLLWPPDPGTLAGLVYEGHPLAEARRAGDTKVEGDEEAVERFFGLFPLAEPAAPDAGPYHRSDGRQGSKEVRNCSMDLPTGPSRVFLKFVA